MASESSINVGDAVRAFQRVKERMRSSVAKALYQETQVEAAESKRKTPVLTGNLRSTVRGTEPVVEGERIYCQVVAGGEGFKGWVSYAFYVHENLEAFHNDGEARFIMSTLEESRPFMAERVAARMRKNGDFK